MKTFALTLALTLATATITGAALAPLPAHANGRPLVFEVNPTTRAEARDVRRAIATVAAREEIRTNGLNSQSAANAAAILNNRGSMAVVQQHGNGHTGSITQTGRNHAYGLFQFGANTEHHVVQEGRRQTGMTVIIGR